ncbi:DUF4333 domain-containing protein [Nocardiopsis valliformis]|uniref:DUF4333 domain-containing protein n=1 Tax=Nocardiopsis valliformis TaxID=239974 RepID=UPI0003458B34|nr:DUF4333 domain-containing protein [Nocardiopsis valliformis]
MQQFRRHGIIAGLALGALPLLLATGCSFDFSVGDLEAVDTADAVDTVETVDAAEVAEKSSAMLAEQFGETPDDFTCSEDLPAEVGAEIRCELTNGGESGGVTVTTTEVDGSDVKWDIKVDDAPTGDAAETQDGSSAVANNGQVSNVEIINQSTPVLEAAGYSPDNFVCSDTHILAQVGAELGCQFLENGVNHPITVTVTSVEGSDVKWDIHFDE